MRFSSHLVKIANEFRMKHLHSDDEKDDTNRPEKWEDFQPVRSDGRGGPYMCVHLRRKDYVYSRAEQIPSIPGAAEQITRKLENLQSKGAYTYSQWYFLLALTDFPTIQLYRMFIILQIKTFIPLCLSRLTRQIKNLKN